MSHEIAPSGSGRRLFWDYEGDRLALLADENALGLHVVMAESCDAADPLGQMVLFEDADEVRRLRDALTEWLETRQLSPETD